MPAEPYQTKKKKAPNKAGTLWDKLSKLLRTTQPYCELGGPDCQNTFRLQCHHGMKRSKSVRWFLWDVRAIVVVCGICHNLSEINATAFTRLLEKRLPDVAEYIAAQGNNLHQGEWDRKIHLQAVQDWLPYIETASTIQEAREMMSWQELYERNQDDT